MKRILVVDDSEVEGIYIKGIMRRMSEAELSVVKTYEDAGKLCEKEYFDLVLMDIVVPEGDAASLVSRIHNSSVNHKTAVVGLGSAADFSEDNYLKKTGLVNYIEKPVAFNMIKAAISMYS